MNNNPIGIFDSGVGGLSVFKEIINLLKNENIIYFADTLNNPYGNKSKESIIEFSKKITEFLISKNCKIIIVACNTATSNAINYLRKTYDIHFIGMEPATKPAALNTKTGNIAVLATKGTLESEKFLKTKSEYASNVNVFTTIGKGLVEIVEQNKINETETINLLKKFIIPFVDNNVDQIVLGCTHYPFLSNKIQEIINTKKIKIINPAKSVAIHTKNILIKNKILSNKSTKGKYEFYSSSENTDNFKTLLKNHFNINNKITTIKL